jgi:hypothetical protein
MAGARWVRDGWSVEGAIGLQWERRRYGTAAAHYPCCCAAAASPTAPSAPRLPAVGVVLLHQLIEGLALQRLCVGGRGGWVGAGIVFGQPSRIAPAAGEGTLKLPKLHISPSPLAARAPMTLMQQSRHPPLMQ